MSLEDFKHSLGRLKKCNQYWDEMNPTEGGRTCAKCDKTIVDFSGMSFSDIAIFMSESKQPVCGYYLPGQLRKMNVLKPAIPVALGVTLLASPLLASPTPSSNQIVEHSPVQQHNDIIPSVKTEPFIKSIDTIILTGSVYYFDTVKNSNLAVSYATVMIKGTRQGTVTNENGVYRLAFSPETDTGKIYLVFSSIGLEITEVEVILNQQKEIKVGNIILNRNMNSVTEFYVTVRKRSGLSKFWRKITKPFRKS
jgi:hypothetical protein